MHFKKKYDIILYTVITVRYPLCDMPLFMSKIGKKPIVISAGVTVEIKDGVVHCQGKNGNVSVPILPYCAVELKDGEDGKQVRVTITERTLQARANWGTMAALIKNAIVGARDGFKKQLQLEGIGYRAAVDTKGLSLALGFSHPVTYPAPLGITFTVEKNIITISGARKDVVGKVAAEIRKFKKPEPYQGKGIRYVGEVVRRKAGKKAAAAGGVPVGAKA